MVMLVVGSVKVTLDVAVHPFASVIVTVLTPALNPVAVWPLPPDGAHE